MAAKGKPSMTRISVARGYSPKVGRLSRNGT